MVERTRDDFPWDPGECYYIPDLTTTQIRRERNRLLRNYDADARFRRRIAPFYGAHGKGDVFLFCENGLKIDVVVQVGVFGPAPSQELNAITFNWRIRRVNAHNELADVDSLHLIAKPNGSDSGIRCIRPGCCQAPFLVPISYISCNAMFEGFRLTFAMAVFFVNTSGCHPVHGGRSLSSKTLAIIGCLGDIRQSK